MALVYVQQRIVVGDTTDFQLRAERNGVVWDLTSATVTLWLEKPSGALASFAATVTNGPAGIADYISRSLDVGGPVNDIDVEGDWIKQWHVVDALGESMWTEEEPFTVMPRLG